MPRKTKMSDIKGFFLLLIVLGAMYLGVKAEAEVEAGLQLVIFER